MHIERVEYCHICNQWVIEELLCKDEYQAIRTDCPAYYDIEQDEPGYMPEEP